MAVRVLGVDPTGKSDEQVGQEGIDRLRKFWTALGAPTRLADYDIDDSQLDVMVEKAMANGSFRKLQNTSCRRCAYYFTSILIKFIKPVVRRSTAGFFVCYKCFFIKLVT